MGELLIHEKNISGKRKRLSTRVDLTPMVDLGFLLITFFIFTTTMNEPKSMKLSVPKDTTTDFMKAPESKTISLILLGKDRLCYYEGSGAEKLHTTDYTSGLRTIINEKRKSMRSLGIKPEELVVLIKPTKESSFRNVVDVLDEMIISQVKIHVLMEPNIEEIKKAADLRVRS